MSENERVFLLKQQRRFGAHDSKPMVERSRALIWQIDEQINRMEHELSWFGGPAAIGLALSPARTVENERPLSGPPRGISLSKRSRAL